MMEERAVEADACRSAVSAADLEVASQSEGQALALARVHLADISPARR